MSMNCLAEEREQTDWPPVNPSNAVGFCQTLWIQAYGVFNRVRRLMEEAEGMGEVLNKVGHGRLQRRDVPVECAAREIGGGRECGEYGAGATPGL